MKTWRFYWLTGKSEDLSGETVEKAFGAVYGAGALRAVDFYQEVIGGTVDHDYVWDADKRDWRPTTETFNSGL